MSNTEFLDLDAIVPPKRQIRLKGKVYELRDMSLRNFIDITRRTDEIERKVKRGEATVVDVVEAHLESVRVVVDGIEDEVLATLTDAQLQAIVTFARETAKANAKQNASEATGKAAAEAVSSQ